jgi:hypothetical protein
MIIAEAHNVPISSDKTDDRHGSFQIIAEPAPLVVQGHRGQLRQKLTSQFVPSVGFFPTALNFLRQQPKSLVTK